MTNLGILAVLNLLKEKLYAVTVSRLLPLGQLPYAYVWMIRYIRMSYFVSICDIYIHTSQLDWAKYTRQREYSISIIIEYFEYQEEKKRAKF